MPNKLIFPSVLIALVTSTVCSAQIRGYINGTQSLTSFNPATGELLNSFSTGGTGLPFAVALNDATLYLPANYTQDPWRALNIVNGLSGALLKSIPLVYQGYKAVLTSQGGTAFVMASENNVGKIFAVNLRTQAVIATLTMPVPDAIEDIALSPDDATLYVSVNCHGSCTNTQGACPLASGICAFSVSTLALKATIQKPHGYMAVSQDSKSLYISGLGAADGLFFVSDASTLEVKYQIPFPYRSLGPPAVSPVGHYAVIFTGPNQQSSVTAYTLDTSTNRIVSEFFANAPLGGGVAPGLEGIAFAPNGLSLWMLLGCNTFPTCGGFDPTGRVLAGVSFPSGQVIGTVSIPSDVASIAFPRIVPR